MFSTVLVLGGLQTFRSLDTFLSKSPLVLCEQPKHMLFTVWNTLLVLPFGDRCAATFLPYADFCTRAFLPPSLTLAPLPTLVGPPRLVLVCPTLWKRGVCCIKLQPAWQCHAANKYICASERECEWHHTGNEQTDSDAPFLVILCQYGCNISTHNDVWSVSATIVREVSAHWIPRFFNSYSCLQ